ncbi:hypothetical protein BH24ACT3_BH24ACT3_02000 [soil metagenome]
MDRANVIADVARYPWYHTIDLGDGVVTPGVFDHRPVLDRYLLPESTAGLRCLDVGTMDGFWAFEMERRGSTDVVAVDIEDPDALDWPPAQRAKVTDKDLDRTKAERFAMVHGLRQSDVVRELRSVYDLDTDLGHFDLVFCGDLLIHLKDPITALERILAVCRGQAIIVTPVERLTRRRKRPIAEFDGIDHFRWWNLSEAALARMLTAVGFRRVERGSTFELPTTGGDGWRGLRAVMRATA